MPPAVDAQDGRSSAAAVAAVVPAGLAGGAAEVAAARHLAAPVLPDPRSRRLAAEAAARRLAAEAWRLTS